VVLAALVGAESGGVGNPFISSDATDPGDETDADDETEPESENNDS
jgi:hypothetical protein